MKKKIVTTSVLLLIVLAAFAQETYTVASPDITLRDNISAAAGKKKVKALKSFILEEGKPILKSVTTFDKTGKLISDRLFGNFKRIDRYSYSGDTTIVRSVYDDVSPYGGEAVNSMSKFDSSGKILSGYSGEYYLWADSMKPLTLSSTYTYENGLLTSTKFTDGEEYIRKYDNHGGLIETRDQNNVQYYRRVYDGDRLKETYYRMLAEHADPERLVEKLEYHENGLVSSHESHQDELTFTYRYTYDTAKRLLSETGDCTTTKYTYDVGGRLMKRDFVGCDQSTESTTYGYNTRGLLISSITKRGGKIEETITYTYTYWP